MRTLSKVCLLAASLLLVLPSLHAQGIPQLTPAEIQALKALADSLQAQNAQAAASANDLKQAAQDATAAAKAAQTQSAALPAQVAEAIATVSSAAAQATQKAQAELEAQRAAATEAAARLQSLQPPPAVSASGDPTSDKVPCLMDRTELYAARGMNDPALVTPDQQRNIADGVQSEEIKKVLKSSISQAPVSALTYLSSSMAQISSADASSEQKEQALATIQRNTPPTFTRPTNIGCSMSIFSWNIARMVFGRTVANNYLAVQISVRNLDQTHDFLIHDAELAVDAYSAQLERFQASHERQAVRAVVLYGQSYDRRAIWSNSVEAIGMILGSIVAVPSANDILTSATGAYTAGLIPSWHKLFPDLTNQNLINVNDLGFSAAAASRIVVPKGGSVPFVVFIPLKPLEQACWLQDGYVPSRDVAPGTACSATQNNKLITDYKTLKYKDWQAAQITALQKHAWAVVAGIHIKDANGAPAARSVTCDNQDSAGAIHIALLTGKSLTCTLTGADLDSVKTINALSIANPAVPAISAPASTSGDSTVAKATFPADSVTKFVDTAYDLHAVNAAGTDVDLKQTLTIVPAPTIDGTKFNPATIPAAGIPSLTLTGTNLLQVTAVVLTAAGKSITIKPSAQTATMLQLNFVPALAQATYSITLQVDANQTVYNPVPAINFPAP